MSPTSDLQKNEMILGPGKCACATLTTNVNRCNQPNLKPTVRERAAVRPDLAGLSFRLEPLLTNAEVAWARLVGNDFPDEDSPGPAAAPAAVAPPCPVAAAPAAAVDDSTAPATAIALAHTAESCRMLITCMRRESRRASDASICLLLLLPGPSTTAAVALPVLGGEVFLMASATEE